MSARKEVDDNFEAVACVLAPMTKGDGGDHRGEGGDKRVIAARVAVQSLRLLRQWARLGAAVHDAKPAPEVKAKKRRA